MKRREFILATSVSALAMAAGTLPSQALAGTFEDFFLAIRFDDENRLKALLLRGMDPNTVNAEGFPALVYAMMQDSPNAVRLLLQSRKLNPDSADARGETPLKVACSLDKPDWVSVLLAKGARQGGNGEWTALHNAAAAGSVRSIDMLVRAGAQVDVLSPNDSTPLMMAARQGREEAVRVLLKLGANPSLKNQAGFNAAGYALRAQRKELAMEIMKKEKALRKVPSKPNSGSQGLTGKVGG